MPTASKPGPSFVCSVCSRDIVRVMAGHSQGSSLVEFSTWQQILQLVHVDSSLQKLTLAQTSTQHNPHIRAIQNPHHTRFTSGCFGYCNLVTNANVHNLQTGSLFPTLNSTLLHTRSYHPQSHQTKLHGNSFWSAVFNFCKWASSG